MDAEVTVYENVREQLSPKEVKVYGDFAKARGRKEYNGGSILPTKEDKDPIDRLYEDEGILESHHRDAGRSFNILSDIAQGKFITPQHYEEARKQTIPAALKCKAIYRQLSEGQKDMVKIVLFAALTESDYPWLYKLAPNLQDAFERLYEAMKSENILCAVNEIQGAEIKAIPPYLKIKVDKLREEARI